MKKKKFTVNICLIQLCRQMCKQFNILNQTNVEDIFVTLQLIDFIIVNLASKVGSHVPRSVGTKLFEFGDVVTMDLAACNPATELLNILFVHDDNLLNEERVQIFFKNHGL